jgi:hypothetical protein
MKDYENHPLSELFPIISAAEIKDLAEDIKERGLQSPIVLYEGKILDGRHRYEGCSQAGVTPKFETYDGDDPVGFVFSANLRRRHLTDGQRAMIAARLATMTHGGDRKSEGRNQVANLPLDQEKAAETLDVSPRSVRVAKTVMDASPKLTKQVDAGKLSLNAAHQQVKAKEKANGEPVLDDTDFEIPPGRVEIWARRGEVRDIANQIANIQNRLIAYQEAKDELFSGVSVASVVERLRYVSQQLRGVQLHAVCPSCGGRNYKNCTDCKGRGFLSKFAWERVPDSIKEVRSKASKK